MPVKKKAVKTEEISTETETVTEKVENIDIPEEDLNIQKPKKPKRELTEKQKLNFAKLQEANKLRYAEKKKLKEEALNNKITEVEIVKEDKPIPDKPPAKQEVAEEEEEEEEVVIKKKPVKKKKKKIVIEQDSSSDSEEIVISRRRGRRKSKPIDIPQEQPKPEPMIDITPVEEKKEEIPLNKKYSAKQILQSLGL
tara:strand:+ start:312 stop:899 length:588 start_codon:yes stop_codon:yes gene_type:complete